MINIGQNQINQMYVGSTPVQSVYVGNTQVWSGKSWHTLYEGDGSWLNNINLNAYTTSDRVIQYRSTYKSNFADTWGTYGEPVKYRIYIEAINYISSAYGSSNYQIPMSNLPEPTPVTPFYIESDDNNEITINSTASGTLDPSKIYLQFEVVDSNGANNLRFNVYYGYEWDRRVGYYVYSVNPKITKIEAYY